MDLEELEGAARKNPLMPSAVVLELVSAVRMARWQSENYRKLAEYYREAPNAEPVRPVEAEG